MSRSLKMGGALVGFGVLLSQLGHLLVYQLQFGSAAQAVQSSGAHAYFPALVKTALGFGAAAVLAGLLVVGASRLVASGSAAKPVGGPSFVRLLALTFTVQMTCFGLQETIESLAAGAAVAPAPHILLLGAVGQLPVAALAAVALKWLLVRFESAIIEIRVVLASVRISIAPVAVAVSAWCHFGRHLVLRPVAGPSLAKRGPPSLMRLSSN
ncbi:MAG: hypothetical protein ACYDA0_08185 [Candidatus Dormibacteraceae bacterium]